MTAIRLPGFIGPDYQARTFVSDKEGSINLFLERSESSGSTSPMTLCTVPGVTQIGTSSSSPGRAHFSESGREFAVFGTSFSQIAEDGTETVRGTVAADSNPATIVSNGDGGGQLLITSGSNAYVYDVGTTTFSQVAALNGKATQAGYLDGYGLVLDKTTSTFYISSLLDFTTFATGTDFAQRSGASDSWVAMKVNGIYIGLFGEHTSEYWYDAGGSSFPFALHPNGRTSYGCGASFTPAVGEGNLFRLGQSEVGQRYVLQATGFTDQVVSDTPRQIAFNRYDMVDDAIGEVVNYEGHLWYILTFPDADATHVYDLSTNTWFPWLTWIAEQNDFSALRPRWHAVAFGEHRFLDSETGGIYKLDPTVATDVDSRPIVWERTAPTLNAANERIFHSYIELLMQTGDGDPNSPEPQVMMTSSDDGGKNWKAERWRGLGFVGEYDKRVRWEQLGSARRRTYRFRGSGVIGRLVDCFIEFGQPVQALRRAQ